MRKHHVKHGFANRKLFGLVLSFLLICLALRFGLYANESENSQISLLKTGERALQEKRFSDAVAAAYTILRQNPDNKDAYAILAYAQFFKGQYLYTLATASEAEMHHAESSTLYHVAAKAAFLAGLSGIDLEALEKYEESWSHEQKS